MDRYECKQEIKIQHRDVDFKDEMKPSVVMAWMAEIAGVSADELGLGYSLLKPQGLAFVISNTCIEWEKAVPLYEKVCLKTWPLPPSFAVFRREYLFENMVGEILIKASSRWCLMDMKSGKIVSSKVLQGQDYTTYNTRMVLDDVQWKLPTFSWEGMSPSFSLTIANSEYDHNMHVNNARYADYCLNCFSLAELKTLRIKRFAITYVKQCHEGETLSFYRQDMGDGVYGVQGVNTSGEMVVCAQITMVNCDA